MLKPLDVALVTETYPPEINGVAMTLGNLVQGLRVRGWRVQVVRPRQPGEAEACDQEWLRPSLPVPRYAGLRIGLPSGLSLHGRWRRRRPDLVHVVTEGPLGLSALRSARRLGIPVSSGFHTNFHDYSRHYGLSWMHGAVERYLKAFHNRTRCTLVPAQDVITQLSQRGFRNLMLLGRGVDAGLFTPELRSDELRASWGADRDTLVALHVGRVAPEKNIPLALRAFAAIRAVRPDAKLVVVGEGPERARLAASAANARFTGALPRAELARAYASADLFLFPSMSETYGNVLMEAMASGLPAVSFDYAAPRQHVRDGVNGWTVPFGDGDAFVRRAVAIASDDARRRGAGIEARRTALAVGWEHVVDRFAAILRRVAGAAHQVEA